jgi:hypothetical protein
MMYIQEMQKIIDVLEADEKTDPEMLQYVKDKFRKKVDEYIAFIKTFKP